MRDIFLCFVLVAGSVALATPIKKAATVPGALQQLQDVVREFTHIKVVNPHVVSHPRLLALAHKLQTILHSLNDADPDFLATKRSLIGQTQHIQSILDKFVASVVNGTPLSPELVALGADGDPETFITKVIIMAASNMTGRRDLMSVASVI